MTRTWIVGVFLLACSVGACAEDVAPPTSSPDPPGNSLPDPTTPPTGPTGTPGPLPGPGSVDVSWVPPGPVGIVQPTPRPCPTPSTSPSASTSAPPTACSQEPPSTTYKAASDAWTAAFTSRDCAAIGALGTGKTSVLYKGLRDACTASADNDPAKWAAAVRALAAANDTYDCPERLARTLLTRLVEAHQRAPQARLRFVASTVAPQDACR